VTVICARLTLRTSCHLKGEKGMPKAKVQPGKKRLQYDFNEVTLQAINRVQARIGAGSGAEVVRRAIHIMDLCTDPENRVCLEKPSGNLVEMKFV
jgi:hypothetical protein